MNLDTDLQWAFWEGVQKYYKKNEPYLQAQLGNPEGPEKPNKKFYDPRVWLRKGEESFISRLQTAFEDLNCINRNCLKSSKLKAKCVELKTAIIVRQLPTVFYLLRVYSS